MPLEELASTEFDDAVTTWQLDVIDKVALLTFARPPANWMDQQSMTELADHLDELAGRTGEATVVMLTGGVDGYFIAHADLDDLGQLAAGRVLPGDPRAWVRALAMLEDMPQPTVAAIDGQAWGGGCETALACSMRLGSERAHLGQPEVAVGIIPGAGGSQRLPRLVGPAIGMELCTTGRIVRADEALRIGLLNAVLPTEGFIEAALTWCGKITRHSPAAVFAAKRAVIEGLRGPLADGLALERRLSMELNRGEDARARMAVVDRPDAK
jgi:enoyl-CoA hydratase